MAVKKKVIFFYYDGIFVRTAGVDMEILHHCLSGIRLFLSGDSFLGFDNLWFML